MEPIKFRDRLSVRISVILSIIVIPMLFLTAWRIVNSEAAIAEELLIQKGKSAALAGAAAYGAILDLGVETKQVELDDLLNPKYEKIPYPFKLTNPRFHTKFDTFTDAHVVDLQDTILNSTPDFIYASGNDRGGFTATSHHIYAEDPRDDEKWNELHSRKKRKYETPMHMAAAVFLGSPLQPVLVQQYPRDGKMAWDIAAPITVKGQHFGAFRVGLRFDRIEAYRVTSITQLTLWFGLLIVAVVLVIFGIVALSLRPLNSLSRQALVLAGGDDLEMPLLPYKNDEVGGVAYALDQLRRGMLGMYKNTVGLRAKNEALKARLGITGSDA